jgi:hypothetical protein
MEGIKEYLLGVIGAALLCSIVSQIAGKERFLGTTVKLITGAFMLIVLVAPITDIQIQPAKLFSDISLDADRITSAAANSSRESIAGIIKEQTQTYILDKANTCGVELRVEVVVSDGEIPEPVSVILSGDVSPYNKKILTQAIENDLGIPSEAQIWN